MIVTVLLLAVAIGLALLVQEHRRGAAVHGLYSAEIGPLHGILRGLGLVEESFSFRGTPNTALFSTIAMVISRFAGFQMLILLTRLQAIPLELYEAAAAADPGPAAGAERQRVAAGLRPALHPHPGPAGEQYADHGHGHLPGGVLRFELLVLVTLNVLQLRVLRRRD